MIKADRYLKPIWVRRHFELAHPLLPSGVRVVLQMGGKRVAEMGESGPDLIEGAPGVQVFPLTLEGERVGMLLCLPTGSETSQVTTWGCFLTHALQGMLESEHVCHSVAREALESYREMALLQRAVTDLNLSLKPAAVAAALLKNFDGHNSTADYGAMFIYTADSGSCDLDQVFGEDATQAFLKLKDSRLFAAMTTSDVGDIVNNLPTSLLWAGEVADFGALLWLPLISHDEKLGLLVLASRRADGFSAADLKRAQTLSSVAATALRNAQLYAAEQKMFQFFVMVIATAIDAKSPYTAGHCRRVQEIALMLAEKTHQADHGPFAAFTLDEDGRNSLAIAAMLHDCGKVVTPEWVIDKATKLESINNRLALIAMRFEVLRRDALIDYHRCLTKGQATAERIYQERLHQLDEDFAILEKCNLGGEFISPENIRRIRDIADIQWCNGRGEVFPLLSENEVSNLCTQRGTLNQEERKIIEDHVVHTIKMLSQVPFPRSLRNVAEYAGGHHEHMDGSGYPRGLKREQLSIPARIMAIADIFEALTAPDRPYRKGGTLSWAINIMYHMKQDGHIDGDLFDLFLSEGVYLTYAKKHLTASQIDHIDIADYLG